MNSVFFHWQITIYFMFKSPYVSYFFMVKSTILSLKSACLMVESPRFPVRSMVHSGSRQSRTRRSPRNRFKRPNSWALGVPVAGPDVRVGHELGKLLFFFRSWRPWGLESTRIFWTKSDGKEIFIDFLRCWRGYLEFSDVICQTCSCHFLWPEIGANLCAAAAPLVLRRTW